MHFVLRHRLFLFLVALFFTLVSGMTTSAYAGTVHLRFYDRLGKSMTSAATRSLMGNGSASHEGDALLDPVTWRVLATQPLANESGGLAFTTTSPAAAGLLWPTRRGFSLVVIDNGGLGFSADATINFTAQAALDTSVRLEKALAARPSYSRSSAFNAVYQSAQTHLGLLRAAPTDSVKGAEGYLALDDLADAYGLLLSEYGPAFARANRSNQAPQIGFTLDTTDNYASNLRLAKSIGGADTWIRIVCDKEMTPADIKPIIADAKTLGIHVMVQPVDSYEVSTYSRSAYLTRIKTFVDALPDAAAWEVGNEVNGSWLGAGMGDKIADAAAYVNKARPSTNVVVTLYWQLGTDAASWSMMNWVQDNLPAATRANIDTILVSLYIEDAPLDLALDGMMERLHREFPNQKIGLGELGYWNSDTSKIWWAFNKTDPTHAGRQATASYYYAATLGYPYSIGGVYWWYFAEEGPTDAALVTKIREVVAKTQGSGTTTPPPPPPPPPPVNLPPSSSWVFPAANVSVSTTSVLQLTATAIDPEGAMGPVEIWDGSVLLGVTTKNGDRYTLAWRPTFGTHSLTIRASDTAGLSSTSAALRIDVVNNAPAPAPTPNRPPTIAWIYPTTTISVPTSLTLQLTVTASDPDGDLLRIEFWDGTKSLGVATRSGNRYSLMWRPAVGTHSLTARATDPSARTATTFAISVQAINGPAPVVVAPSTLPAPVLQLPNRLPMGSIVSVEWNGTMALAGFVWRFEVLGGGTSPAGFPLVLQTAQAQVDLGSLSLPPGQYHVVVQAQAIDGTLSPIAEGVTELFTDNLQGIRAFPNPWRKDKHASIGITFDHLTSRATITLFTLSGYAIKTLYPDAGSTSWDLTNDHHDPVASGLYMYLIKNAEGEHRRGLLAVIR